MGKVAPGSYDQNLDAYAKATQAGSNVNASAFQSLTNQSAGAPDQKQADAAKVLYGLNLGSAAYQSHHPAITQCKKDMEAIMDYGNQKIGAGNLSAGMAIQKSVVGLDKQLASLIAAGNDGHLTKEGQATMKAAIAKVAQQYGLDIGGSDGTQSGGSANGPSPGQGAPTGDSKVPYGLNLGSTEYQKNHPAATNCKNLLQTMMDQAYLETSGGDASLGMQIQQSVVSLTQQLDGLIADGDNGDLTKSGEATMQAAIDKAAASYGLSV